jgi:hypothetical protein
MGGGKTGAEAPAYSRSVPLGRENRNRGVVPNSRNIDPLLAFFSSHITAIRKVVHITLEPQYAYF